MSPPCSVFFFCFVSWSLSYSYSCYDQTTAGWQNFQKSLAAQISTWNCRHITIQSTWLERDFECGQLGWLPLDVHLSNLTADAKFVVIYGLQFERWWAGIDHSSASWELLAQLSWRKISGNAALLRRWRTYNLQQSPIRSSSVSKRGKKHGII